MTQLSVQPEWCLELPLQQQSVMLLAARGPDGIPKSHPCKDVQRAYRASVIKQARLGRLLNWGEKGDTFMSLDLFSSTKGEWGQIVRNYFQNVDSLPHHFHMHLMHGAEILGYHHPDERFRTRWNQFYNQCCWDMHVPPETKEQMDARLSDWNRKDWDIDIQ